MVDQLYSGKEFVGVLDELGGLARTIHHYEDRYRSALDNYSCGGDEANLDNTIEPLTVDLGKVFRTLDDIDEMVEEEKMVVYVEKNGNKGHWDMENWLQEAESNKAIFLDSFRNLVIFAYDFDDELQIARGGDQDSMSAFIIQNTNYIVEVWQQLDQQYDWLIELEAEVRRKIEEDQYGIPVVELPIYSFLNGPYNSRAAGLNREVEQLLETPAPAED